MKKLTLISGLIIVIFFPLLVKAQEDFIVKVGEDKVFTEYNYHNISWEGTWNNGESIPYGPGGSAIAQSNYTQVSMGATAGHYAVAEAEVGVKFNWELDRYAWEQIKDQPVKVTIDFSYGVYAGSADGNGFSRSGLNIVGFSDPWLDYISYERGEQGWDSHSSCQSGSCYIAKTYTTTIGRLESLNRTIAILVYSHVKSDQKHTYPEGVVTHAALASTSIGLNGIKIEFPLQIEVLDGADFSAGQELSSSPEQLAVTKGVPVRGAVTDGITRLLLRLNLEGNNEVTFTLEGTGDPNEDGILRSIDGSQAGRSIKVRAEDTSLGDKAFAIYQAPESFVRESYRLQDEKVSERTLRINVSSDRSPPFSFSAEIKLVRPPVILIHGLWDYSGTWNNFIRGLKNKIDGIRIFAVDYSKTNASHLESNMQLLGDFIKAKREQLQLGGIAMVQADVFGHSMGGLLGRMWAGIDKWNSVMAYYRKNNFIAGDINKLVTIDSPHFGSFLADFIINFLNDLNNDEKNAFLEYVKEKGYPLGEGAITDLMTTSLKIKHLNRITTNCASHAIIGEVDENTILKGKIVIPFLIIKIIESSKKISIIPNKSDIIVSVESQAGGLSFPETSISNHHHMNAITNQDVIDKAIDLLDTKANSSLFNIGFPTDS